VQGGLFSLFGLAPLTGEEAPEADNPKEAQILPRRGEIGNGFM